MRDPPATPMDTAITPTGQLDNTSALYAIKKSPGKGLVVFANGKIFKGTRIITEEPLFSIEKPFTGHKLVAEISRLSTEIQGSLMRLHDTRESAVPPVARIFRANAFGTGSTSSIFLRATRINHSCVPNCHFSWNTNLNRLTVHAVKDIATGQEMTVSYGEVLRTREQRKELLTPSYDFECNCPACQPHTEFGRANDIRRHRMFDLDQQIAVYDRFPEIAKLMHGHPDALPAVLGLADLLLEEGVVNGELWGTYYDAVTLYKARGYNAQALVYARKKLEVQLYSLGADSQYTQETLNEIHELRKT